MRKAILVIFIVGFCACLAQINAQSDLQTKFRNNKLKVTAKWNGEWTRASRFYNAELKIKTISANLLSFELIAANGANSGEIKGKAAVRGNMAFFDDHQPAKNSVEEDCRVLLTNENSKISIDVSKGCQGYGGSGVSFEGDYERGKGKISETNFVYLEVFPNKTLDEKFKNLVGAKTYESFLDAFHIINEEEDSDGFNAKVFSACVRGVCPSLTGIIMYNDAGEIWAAVADDKYPDGYFVNYFTNAAAWREKLPKTIENWISRKELGEQKLNVNYKSK